MDRFPVDTTDSGGLRTGRAAFATLAAVHTTLLMAMMVIAVALPAVQREFELGNTGIALVNSAYPVSFCGLLLLGGRLGDLVGWRKAFMVGTAVFAVGCAATALAPGFIALLVARFCQGCGAAVAAPAALALLRGVFPRRDQYVRAIAVWGGLPMVGGAIGLLTAGPIVNVVSWRWLFLVPTLIALAAVAIAPKLLPDLSPSERQRLDWLGGALVTTGLALVCYGLVGSGERGWSASVVVTVACGAGLLAAFLFSQTRRADPLLPLSFFASPRRLAGLCGLAAGATGVFSLSFFLPLYFQQTHDYSPALTSAAFVPYSLAMFATSAFTGRLVSSFGARTVTVAGLLTGAAGLLLLATMDDQQSYLGTMLAGMIVFPAGALAVFAGATVAALEDVPETHAGVSGGLLNTAMEFGPTVGFAALVAVAGSWTTRLQGSGTPAHSAIPLGYGAALTVAAGVFLVIALACWLLLRPSARRR
ncbi:Predicted arabinose efflux permease, MFS family [Prauserella marina]|uniref:Predicted arabinose efflux permease, MFS family n=1 Tax=Prauserella marina TaxID=530584 RepID=A0A1G6W152_9PSEU|nr:MFS transporter [Prauserella marina]PWV73945.1 putative MFS family arabinose efflux permease [Prauserella marina]SDD59514.1 Predicted arabinose efflux permease, MFS family [Prauserella marina]